MLTSILNRIPFIGGLVYKMVVGGFAVTNVTLVRVFSAHVCLAFVILGLRGMHLFYLHKRGSNNPLFVRGGYRDIVLFHSYFSFKDGFLFIFLLTLFFSFMLIFPDGVLDVERYIQADPLVTPVSIKPEWYFLAFYAMLRSIESKVGGLVLVLCFLFILWLPRLKRSCNYSICRQLVFWSLASIFLVLRYLGACHPERPFVLISKLLSIFIVVLLLLFKGLWVIPYSGGFPRFVS